MNEQFNRKLAPAEVDTLLKALETDIQATTNRLTDERDKSESNLRNTGIHEESFSWEFMTDLEEKLEHTESTHYLVTMLILSMSDGSVDSRRSAQSFRSGPSVFLIKVELKFRYHPC